MSEPSRPRIILRRTAAWTAGWVLAGSLYLLLIDTTSLPELIVGAVVATLAATGFELAREQRVAGERIRLEWLLGAYRPVLKVPRDIALLAMAAARQLVRRDAAVGRFRAVKFPV